MIVAYVMYAVVFGVSVKLLSTNRTNVSLFLLQRFFYFSAARDF